VQGFYLPTTTLPFIEGPILKINVLLFHNSNPAPAAAGWYFDL
jgi:hypothetical protein